MTQTLFELRLQRVVLRGTVVVLQFDVDIAEWILSVSGPARQVGRLTIRSGAIALRRKNRSAIQIGKVPGVMTEGSDIGNGRRVVPTEKMFDSPEDPRTQDYVHGRFG